MSEHHATLEQVLDLVNSRFDQFQKHMDKLEERIEGIMTKELVEVVMSQTQSKLQAMDTMLGIMQREAYKVNDLERRVLNIEKAIFWVVSIIVGTVILAVLALVVIK